MAWSAPLPRLERKDFLEPIYRFLEQNGVNIETQILNPHLYEHAETNQPSAPEEQPAVDMAVKTRLVVGEAKATYAATGTQPWSVTVKTGANDDKA